MMKREWFSIGIHLGYRYEGSPLIVPDGTPEPPDEVMDYAPTARPGHRAPHAWLKDGRSTLDLFGRGFVLLRFGADPPDAAALIAAAQDAESAAGNRRHRRSQHRGALREQARPGPSRRPCRLARGDSLRPIRLASSSPP